MLKLERQVVLPPPQAPMTKLDLQKMQRELDEANREGDRFFFRLIVAVATLLYVAWAAGWIS